MLGSTSRPGSDPKPDCSEPTVPAPSRSTRSSPPRPTGPSQSAPPSAAAAPGADRAGRRPGAAPRPFAKLDDPDATLAAPTPTRASPHDPPGPSVANLEEFGRRHDTNSPPLADRRGHDDDRPFVAGCCFGAGYGAPHEKAGLSRPLRPDRDSSMVARTLANPGNGHKQQPLDTFGLGMMRGTSLLTSRAQLSGTLPRNLSGTLSRDLSGTLPRDLSGPLPRNLSGPLPRDLSGTLTRDLDESRHGLNGKSSFRPRWRARVTPG